MKTTTLSKWKASDYKAPFTKWTPPKLLYPCAPSEKESLYSLKKLFTPLEPYKELETKAASENALVSLDTPLPDGHIAFLENTAEKCTSPTTKHSQAGMQGAKHWVQRVDTPEAMFRRLTDGYGISLMFGERCHQYIRNSNNWRGISGVQLDLDEWYQDVDTLKAKLIADGKDSNLIENRLAHNETLPKPVYSQAELFDRYPLLKRICSYLIPSASSLHNDRPFKARGIVLFETPITDQRIYRAFSDVLLAEIDCIPANVTKNPVAVGFGNTHNASQAYRNREPDRQWTQDSIAIAIRTEKQSAKQRKQQKQQKAQRHTYQMQSGASNNGENITAFIKDCNALHEMVTTGVLTHVSGTRYRWHASDSPTSCEVKGDGVLHIFSNTMQQASPAGETEPVNIHRFYLYQITGLDLHKDSDKAKCREYLFDKGYGTDPKLYQANRSNTPKLSKPAHTAIPEPGIITLAESERLRNIASEKFINSPADSNVLQINTSQDDTGSGKTTTGLTTAAEAKQRTLGLAETTPLAGQLAIQAGECGFKNPLQLHGRGTGWKDDDDTDTASFETHLCPEYPMIQMIEPYRIPARWYCETKCDHKAECLDFGYLSQFKGLDEHDFISTANPNLFFDPHLRGYLKSLVSVENEQESDISLAFDAMTGGGSPREKNSLDYGIIDDYSIASLFTDITWIDREFKRVKKEWGTGTPTSRFASKVLKAFKKKKPQKIMKSLRKAYDETADDHKEITERLTQHARHGTVVKVWLPKHHTLSQKAVEYVDGGKQFIPNPDYEPTHEQVMLLAIDLPITENKPLDESKDDSGKYKDVRLERIRKDYAYKRLTNDNIPCIRADKLDPHTAIDEKVIVPHTFQTALAAGVKVKDLTPRWQSGSTPIQLLKLLFDYVQNDKNAPVSIRYTLSSNTQKPSAILSFSIPPQAPVGILNHLSMLSATVVPDDLRKVLKGQPVEITEQGGKSIEWADDIKGFQYSDARLTSGSVFEYQKDTDGKRILQQKPTGLTSLAIERLAKINDWAKQTDGLTGFISYKDLADDFCEHLDGFDVITHFDRVAGLNFEGLKLLVVFGYPKVSHEVVMSHARPQYASDSEPLPKGIPDLQDEHGNPISEYLQLTTETEYTEHGYTITERRYNDPRLESIRRQLATDKLRQATGRARFVRWSGTTIVIFTNSPIPCITEKVEHFGNDAFNAADSARDLPAAQKRVNDAIESGDVKAVMETKGVGKSQAYEVTKETRSQQTASETADRDAQIIALHQQGKSQRAIKEELGFSLGLVNKTIKAFTLSTPLLVYTYRQSENVNTPSENPPPPTNPDDTGVDSEAMPEVIAQREAREAAEAEAIDTGDVQAIMETKGVAKSQAYEVTKETRSQQKVERDAQVITLWDNGNGLNASEIERETGVPRATVNRILKPLKTGDQNSDPLLVYTYRTSEKWSPPTNTDVPCVESEPLHISEPDAQTRDTSPPIPPTEYSSLDLETVNQELKRCQERNNYNGAAFLRSHIQKRERQLRTLKKGASMDYYNILTIPGSELFAKIKEINTIANDDTSPERDTAIDALNNLSSLLEQRCGSREDVMIAPGHLLTFGENPQRAA